MKKRYRVRKEKRIIRWIPWFLICVIALLVLVGIIPEALKRASVQPTITTTKPTTTTITQTTMFTTTLMTTITTTTIENVTTTIQVRQAISVGAYSCDRKTDIITLTIANRGNTVIKEDEIKIYIGDEYVGTFGKEIIPGRLVTNSFKGTAGTNIVKVVSPSNSVRIIITCY